MDLQWCGTRVRHLWAEEMEGERADRYTRAREGEREREKDWTVRGRTKKKKKGKDKRDRLEQSRETDGARETVICMHSYISFRGELKNHLHLPGSFPSEI